METITLDGEGTFLFRRENAGQVLRAAHALEAAVQVAEERVSAELTVPSARCLAAFRSRRRTLR